MIKKSPGLALLCTSMTMSLAVAVWAGTGCPDPLTSSITIDGSCWGAGFLHAQNWQCAPDTLNHDGGCITPGTSSYQCTSSAGHVYFSVYDPSNCWYAGPLGGTCSYDPLNNVAITVHDGTTGKAPCGY